MHFADMTFWQLVSNYPFYLEKVYFRKTFWLANSLLMDSYIGFYISPRTLLYIKEEKSRLFIEMSLIYRVFRNEGILFTVALIMHIASTIQLWPVCGGVWRFHQVWFVSIWIIKYFLFIKINAHDWVINVSRRHNTAGEC